MQCYQKDGRRGGDSQEIGSTSTKSLAGSRWGSDDRDYGGTVSRRWCAQHRHVRRDASQRHVVVIEVQPTTAGGARASDAGTIVRTTNAKQVRVRV